MPVADRSTFVELYAGQPRWEIGRPQKALLDVADRRPWLEALRQRVDEACLRAKPAVVACSALKHVDRGLKGSHYRGLS